MNIWTPAKTVDEKLPVMIWIFGGGLMEGYPYEMEFDGEKIAKRGVILVSIAYRLNVFSQLCHPELTAENPDAPTSVCFMDQVAGISWVKRNIANFGGDPENITIFGQSAGGYSVLTLMAAEQTKGLFQRAIVESFNPLNPPVPTFHFFPKHTFEDQEKIGEQFFAYLGVKTLAEARALPAQYIMDKYLESGLFIGNAVDPVFNPSDLGQRLLDNKFNDVDYIIGNTLDEFPVGPVGCETDEEVLAWIDEKFGKFAEEFKALAIKSGKPLKEAATVYRVALGNDILVKEMAKNGRKFYFYNFDPEIPGDDAGSFHSSDLWFEFETLDKCWRPFQGYHYDLARKMCNYWTNFAKTGDPNGKDNDGTDMPYWAPVTPEKPYPIQFFNDISIATEPRDELSEFVKETWHREK